MAYLIDKDALVAEIKRLDALYHISKNLSGDLFIQGLFYFLDTCEVKEEDLEKEAKEYGEREYPNLCNGCKHIPIDSFKAGAKW